MKNTMKAKFLKQTRQLKFGFSIIHGGVYPAEMVGSDQVRIKLADPVFTVVKLNEVQIVK